MTYSALYMLRSVDILVYIHAIRLCPLLLFWWTIDLGFTALYLNFRFDLLERGCLLSPNPDVICLSPFLFLTSNYFKISQLMGVMLIEQSKTRVEASYSDLPIANNIAIYWTPASVICIRCFNGNISSSQYFWICTRSYLTTELHTELSSDRRSIVNIWGEIGLPSKQLGFMVSESQ